MGKKVETLKGAMRQRDKDNGGKGEDATTPNELLIVNFGGSLNLPTHGEIN